jgi:hypothetical protein
LVPWPALMVLSIWWTLGWERAGALVTLFAAPWGPKPPLATPQFLFASNPTAKHGDNTTDAGPRPYETLIPLAAKLGLTTDVSHGKSHFANMVTRWPAMAWYSRGDSC